jgi:hypothetical protein
MFLSFVAFIFDPTFILQFSATSPLPRPLLGHTSTQGRSDMNPGENVSFDYLPSHSRLTCFQSRSVSTTQVYATPSTPITARIHNVLSWRPVRGGHAKSRIVNVPLVQAKEVCSFAFQFCPLISCIMFSGTPQQVLPNKTGI